MTVPTNYCCLNRICGGFAIWQLGWLYSISQNSLFMFLIREGPNRDSREDLQNASQLQVFTPIVAYLRLTWSAGGSDQTCNGSALCWILLWLLWARCVCLALGQ